MDSFVQGWMTFQPSPLSTWIILSAALTKNYNQIQFNVAVETHNKSNHSVDNLWFSFFFIVFFFFFSIRFGNVSRCGIFMRQQFFDSGNGSGEECSSLIPNSFLRLLLFRLLLLLLSLSLYFPIYLFISISIPWIFLSIQISFLYSFIYFSFPFPFSFFFCWFCRWSRKRGLHCKQREKRHLHPRIRSADRLWSCFNDDAHRKQSWLAMAQLMALHWHPLQPSAEWASYKWIRSDVV